MRESPGYPDAAVASLFGMDVLTSDYVPEDKTYAVDFGNGAGHIPSLLGADGPACNAKYTTVGDAWGADAGDPIEDIRRCRDMLLRDMGIRPDNPPYGLCEDCGAMLFRVGSRYECALCDFVEGRCG